MKLENIVKSLEYIKNKGVIKIDALDYLEFDSDEYPEPKILKEALKIVYGGE